MNRWVLGLMLFAGVGLGLLGCAEQKGTAPKAPPAPTSEEAKPTAPKPEPTAPAAAPGAPAGETKPAGTRGALHYYREQPPAEAKPADKKPDEKK
jgi:hypothetical protein